MAYLRVEKIIFSIVCFICFVWFATSSSSSSSSSVSAAVPLLLWSSQPHFGDKHTTIQKTLDEKDFRHLFAEILSNHPGRRNLFDGAVTLTQPKPEVIVAFVYDKLSSNEITVGTGGYTNGNNNHQVPPLSNIRDIVLQSRSSLSFPYMSMEKMSTQLVNAVSDNHNSRIIASYLDNKDGSISGCDALLTELQEEPNIFSNRKTDLILLHYHQQQDHENCMNRVLSLVSSKSHNFIAVLSADAPSLRIQFSFATGRNGIEGVDGMNFLAIQPNVFAAAYATKNTSNVYPGVVYANSTSMLVVLLSLFLLFVLIVGISCTTAIESPPRFPLIPLPVSKEY